MVLNGTTGPWYMTQHMCVRGLTVHARAPGLSEETRVERTVLGTVNALGDRLSQQWPANGNAWRWRLAARKEQRARAPTGATRCSGRVRLHVGERRMGVAIR